MPDGSRLTVNYFCLGALFVFVGSVLLCALGFTVVLPFEATRYWPEVFCTVINSSYDTDVCSCDEQMSVFDTCISEYPCLKVYVTYVIITSPSTAQNGSSLDHQDRRRRHRRRRAPAAVPFVNYSTTSTGEVGQPGQLTEVLDAVENRASSLNVSRDADFITPSHHHTTAEHQPDTYRLTGNGSGPMTSYRDTHRTSSEYYSRDLTATTTADVNQSYVAQLYRSWDDSFLHQCSLTECDDEIWNIRQARLFKSNWGQVGQRFSCYYNPDQQNVVILERTSRFAAINAIVWPCLLLLVGASLWLGLCLGCWSLTSGNTAHKEEYSNGAGASLRIQ